MHKCVTSVAFSNFISYSHLIVVVKWTLINFDWFRQAIEIRWEVFGMRKTNTSSHSTTLLHGCWVCEHCQLILPMRRNRISHLEVSIENKIYLWKSYQVIKSKFFWESIANLYFSNLDNLFIIFRLLIM